MQSSENSAFLVIDNILIDNTLNVVMCQFDLNRLPLAVLPKRKCVSSFQLKKVKG